VPDLSIATYTRRKADCVELLSAVSCKSMRVIRDCFGNLVRLTDERLEHILEHAEMAGMDGELERVLRTPTEVRLSRADDNVRLFYEFYAQTRVGGKWLCVVVKYLANDAFVITAYLTETIKAGETVWPKK
jgi:hypothetical protein